MYAAATWVLLTVGTVTLAILSLEIAHLAHAAWFLGGAVWTLSVVLLLRAFDQHSAARDAMSRREREEHDEDMRT